MEGKILNNLSGDVYNSGAVNKDNLDEKILAARPKRCACLLKKIRQSPPAESCTGGMLGAALTEISGVSAYYKEGVITYSNEAKMKFLGVRRETLERYGAVSSKTAVEMASGAMESAKSDISAAITGIAGPLGRHARKMCGSCVYLRENRGQS